MNTFDDFLEEFVRVAENSDPYHEADTEIAFRFDVFGVPHHYIAAKRGESVWQLEIYRNEPEGEPAYDEQYHIDPNEAHARRWHGQMLKGYLQAFGHNLFNEPYDNPPIYGVRSEMGGEQQTLGDLFG